MEQLLVNGGIFCTYVQDFDLTKSLPPLLLSAPTGCDLVP